MLTGPGLGQNENVFELKVIVQFGLFFRRKVPVLTSGDQLRHSACRFVRGTESNEALRCCPGGDEINNLIVGLCCAHPRYPIYRE